MHHKPSVYYEDVEVGLEITPYERKSGLMEWNRFAGANEEYFIYHMTDEAARNMGGPSVFSMGNLRFAYLYNMLMNWLGEEGDIRKVGCQYRGLHVQEDTLTCVGKVIDKYEKNGEYVVELEVGIMNQRGENTAPGTAVVVLPTRG
jgi:acyl dehydratase